jgi:hypothetical protein
VDRTTEVCSRGADRKFRRQSVQSADTPSLFQTHKLEEGRRMFQIFAARSFEQRVLQQKQLQFLKELEDEETAAEAREARKAKEAQKKKDKRRFVNHYHSRTSPPCTDF